MSPFHGITKPASRLETSTPLGRARIGMSALALFPVAEGNQWEMFDAVRQATTLFHVGPQVVFAGVDAWPLRITKDKPEAYWAPGGNGMVDFYLAHDARGRLYSPGFIAYDQETGEPQISFDSHAAPIVMPGGEPSDLPTYLMINNFPKEEELIIRYSNLVKFNAADASLLEADQDGVQVFGDGGFWRYRAWLDVVDTPAYSGRALAVRYAEGGETAAEENNAEIWYYAVDVRDGGQPLGLVQVTNLHLAINGVFFDGQQSPRMDLKLVRAQVNGAKFGSVKEAA